MSKFYHNIVVNDVNVTKNLDKDQLYIKYGFGIKSLRSALINYKKC